MEGLNRGDEQKLSRSTKNANLRLPVYLKNEKQGPEITAIPGFSEKLPQPPALRCNFCNSMETGQAKKCSREFLGIPAFHTNCRLKVMTRDVDLTSPATTTPSQSLA
jgi:hypothetical protein